MSQVRIELNRGRGWEVRQEGDHPITADELANQLAGYAIEYPHRAFLDGQLIASAKPVKGQHQGLVERHEVTPTAPAAEPAPTATAAPAAPAATTPAPKPTTTARRRAKAAA